MKRLLFVMAILLLCMAVAHAQTETQNPTFPFWKVKGNNGTNSGTNFLGTTDNVSLRLRTNNTERMVIDSTGNVGIGLAAPAVKLHIGGATGVVRIGSLATGGANIATPGASTDKLLYADANGDVKAMSAGATGQVLTYTAGGPAWSTSASNSWGLTGNAGTNSSNFIGTTDPVSLRFRVGNVERMFMDNAGRIGIGTSTLGSVGINYKIEIADETGSTSDILQRVAGSFGGIPMYSFLAHTGTLASPTPSVNGQGLGTLRAHTYKSNNSLGDAAQIWFRVDTVPGPSDAPGSIIFATAPTSGVLSDRIIINRYGYMGVNTMSPTTNVDINGTALFRNGNSSAANTKNQILFSWNSGTDYKHAIKTRHNGTTDANNAFDFYVWDQGTDAVGTTGTNHVFTIDGNNGGSIGIGTTSPDDKVDIEDGGLRFTNTTDSKNWVLNYDVTSDYFYIDEYGAARRMVIANGGNVGIGTTTPSQKLDVAGTTRTTNFQMTTGAANNYIMKSDATGNGSWVALSSLTNNTAWGLTGNSGTSASTNFIGTTDNVNLRFKRNNTNAGLIDLTSVYMGVLAGNANTSGYYNAAIGADAMSSNTTGYRNVALGAGSLQTNQTGAENTALGTYALGSSTGSANTAAGYAALYANTTGTANVAVGWGAMNGNTTGGRNTSLGYQTMLYADAGNDNTAIGYDALRYTEGGNNNTGVGSYALFSNSYGIQNTALGTSAGATNANGNNNVFIGAHADALTNNLTNATAIGAQSRVDASNSLVLGSINGVNGASSTVKVGIGTTTPAQRLDVNGAGLFRNGNSGSDITNNQLVFGWNGSADYQHAIKTRHNAGGDAGNCIEFFVWDQGTDATSNIGSKHVMTIDGNGGGSVGINVTAPNYPLEVSGSASTATGSGYGYLSSGGAGTVPASTINVSIRASDRIVCPEFNAFSDVRIKNILSRSSNTEDLSTINKIAITNYKYIDTVGKGNRVIKKVIAQELEQVYPNAVNTMKDVIPSIYKVAEIKNGVVTVKNDLKAGDMVKLIFAERTEVIKVMAATGSSFTVDVKDEGKVFVYGKQVDDFRTVDYEALSTLSISAIQQLSKLLSELQQQNNRLGEEVNLLKADAGRLNEVELKLNALQLFIEEHTMATAK